MKIAITGHRPNKLGNDYDLTSPLLQRIKTEIVCILTDKASGLIRDNGADIATLHGLILITGMALGIDTLFAKIAIEFNIPFIAALPCVGQSSKWPLNSKNTYGKIIRNPLCDAKWISASHYWDGCMQHRNEWMVDNCDLLIAVWDGTPGGTANCVKYAQSKGKQIIFINPKELEFKGL